MSRPATKAATDKAAADISAFDTSKAADQLRAFAEKGLESTRDVYERFRSAAEDVQKSVDASFEGSRASFNELSLKTVAAMRSNTEAGFSHLEALFSAKSVSEALELQSAFLRKSFEMSVEQGKDLQASLTRTLGKPVANGADKASAA